jgi:hypothetical protein
MQASNACTELNPTFEVDPNILEFEKMYKKQN